jgi:hypothetical protein
VRTIATTPYLPNLQEGNEDLQYRSYAGYGHKQLHLRGYRYDLPDTLLSHANLPLQSVKKFQLLFYRVPGLWWQFYQTLGNKIPSPYPKKVAYLLFINQPIPVPDTLYRNLTAWWQTLKERAGAFAVMLHPLRRDNLPSFADTRKHRLFLMGITSDIMLHAAVPPSLSAFPYCKGSHNVFI